MTFLPDKIQKSQYALLKFSLKTLDMTTCTVPPQYGTPLCKKT